MMTVPPSSSEAQERSSTLCSTTSEFQEIPSISSVIHIPCRSMYPTRSSPLTTWCICAPDLYRHPPSGSHICKVSRTTAAQPSGPIPSSRTCPRNWFLGIQSRLGRQIVIESGHHYRPARSRISSDQCDCWSAERRDADRTDNCKHQPREWTRGRGYVGDHHRNKFQCSNGRDIRRRCRGLLY